MRLFVYEYTCGAALADHPELAALRGEGRAMLQAVLADVAAIPTLRAVTLLDREEARLALPDAVAVRRVGRGDEEQAFRQEAARAECTWVIAPECDEILANRCRWVEEAGGRSVNCTSAAIALAGDKLATCAVWRRQGLPTPATVAWRGQFAGGFPAVWKPRYGAGSQATFLLRSAADADQVEAWARATGYAGPAIVQRWTPGLAASCAWLVGPRQRLPLPPARQCLSDDGRFHYLGGELPLPEALAERAIRLSRLALHALPGLVGYVGVDLVLGDAADGSGDQLIELNPRLTTSYLGLRQLAKTNLAQALLDVARGVPIPTLEWKAGLIRFAACL